MNALHRERLASDEWRQALHDFVVPFTLGDLKLDDLGHDVLEVGPGPGLTTDILSAAVPKLTAVEIDPDLAAALSERSVGTNVEVINADATKMTFPDGRFSGAVQFTMLHHVPAPALQDELFREILRVLRPGGLLIASDGVATDEMESLHADDVYNPVDPETLASRLESIGFTQVSVRANKLVWACHARRP